MNINICPFDEFASNWEYAEAVARGEDITRTELHDSQGNILVTEPIKLASGTTIISNKTFIFSDPIDIALAL